MKKSDPNRGEDRLTECSGGEMGKNVDKEGSGWTVGVMEQQDGAGRAWMWSPVTGKWSTHPHAHPRAGAWTASCRREAARDSACVAGFRWGCHFHVDRPRAPRNLRFLAGEELIGKSPVAAVRRSGDGGFRKENKVTVMKHDHRKSKLNFPFGSDTMRREKRENP